MTRARLIVRMTALALATLLIAGGVAAETNPKIEGRPKDRRGGISTSTGPVVEYATHIRGNMQLVIANNGTFGSWGGSEADPLTGTIVNSCIYPKNTDLCYLWIGAFWIGAVVGRDTLVSVGDEDYYVTQELWPDIRPFGDFVYESIDPTSSAFSADAYSEEDIIAEYTDTLTDPGIVQTDTYDSRPHRPLGIKVEQRSMAWSYSYADDFILFDYQVQNIGVKRLNDVYLGIWVDGDVWHVANKDAAHWSDDIVGFYPSHTFMCNQCEYDDPIAVAYHADNDGDPTGGSFDDKSVPHVVGTRVVRTPSDSLEYSFNWWITPYNASLDFGPRQSGTANDPYRDFGAFLGTPRGDRNRYYILKHKEFDYDLLYTAQDHSLKGWLPPPPEASIYADGHDCRYLLSFGPFDIDPGQRLPVSFAWVGGENLHTSPTNFADLFDPMNPDPFYRSLDFSDLANNSRWASWVYDNPGVDTEGDGYRGKFVTCAGDSQLVEIDTTIDGHDTTITVVDYSSVDTCWIEGDGIPDFRGAGPPPAPYFEVYPDAHQLRIVFNGLLSETSKDVFSGVADFEGYRVYIGRDDRPTSFSLVASYDREDYNKLVLVGNNFVLIDVPFSLDELQRLYGDPAGIEDMDPLVYTRRSPYVHPDFPDSAFIFEAQDFNVSELGVMTPIHKLYPEQAYPSSLDLDSVQADELTPGGRLKYFEYEVVIDDLLPTVSYLVNVTCFDFGSPISGLPALETSVLNGYQEAFALNSSEEVVASALDAYVYPNPFRIDGNYPERGFENREGVQSPERARRIHFANLPSQCRISIYSLDGDLIQTIEHDRPEYDPTSSHESWDLITRNHQLSVTGLYYFVVESSQRSQIGKFVIIK
ncbi:MAG: hypothetical protein ABIE70_08805 [bacterium]